jgi:hypothetical protein
MEELPDQRAAWVRSVPFIEEPLNGICKHPKSGFSTLFKHLDSTYGILPIELQLKAQFGERSLLP